MSTGLVGDPLTVLDRHDPATRTALGAVLSAVVVAAFCVGATVALGSGLADLRDGLLFGLLVTVWVVEDVLRRLLMACLLFWRVVAVDVTHLALLAGMLRLLTSADGRPPGVLDFLLALTCGQIGAAGLALAVLPAAERYAGRPVRGRLGAVTAYGAQRALQGLLRPAVLLALRVAVLAGSGRPALAGFEAGRLLSAPVLLLVSGAGSYLLSRDATRVRDLGARPVRADADRGALLLGGITVAATALLAAATALPWSRHLPLPPGWSAVERGGVAGVWGGYVAAVAVALPYASLGAVVLPQARLLLIRLVDAGAQTAAGAALLVATPSRWIALPLLVGGVSVAVTLAALRPALPPGEGAPARSRPQPGEAPAQPREAASHPREAASHPREAAAQPREAPAQPRTAPTHL